MLSRKTIKIIKSLEHKKYREKFRVFVVEGKKNIEVFLSNSKYVINTLFIADHSYQVRDSKAEIHNIVYITKEELYKISFLAEPNFGLALVEMKKDDLPKINDLSLIVALDGIQDPGNLGTLLRTCAWFGVNHVVCSENCADVFSPKCIQASMGAINFISVSYTNLLRWLSNISTNLLKYGATLDGTSLNKIQPSFPCVIIIGNEGKGISEHILPFIDHKITINNFSTKTINSLNSLNAAIAGSIIIWHFTSFRQSIKKTILES